MTIKRNPMEELTLEFGDRYVELVMMAAETFAPRRPWWFVELSPDEQLWRWLDMRDGIMGWLVEVAAYLPSVNTMEDLLASLEDVFTKPIDDIVPAAVLTDERGDALKELVQAAGPWEAAKHIRKMERLVANRQPAMDALDEASQDQYQVEDAMRANTPVALPEGM